MGEKPCFGDVFEKHSLPRFPSSRSPLPHVKPEGGKREEEKVAWRADREKKEKNKGKVAVVVGRDLLLLLHPCTLDERKNEEEDREEEKEEDKLPIPSTSFSFSTYFSLFLGVFPLQCSLCTAKLCPKQFELLATV